MKFLTVILALFFSSQAFAHVDHALGEDHAAYHVAFYSLLALVVFKGVAWFKSQKKKDKN